MKKELIEYLKTKDITDIHHLWAESKDYYDSKSIKMGGGYADWKKEIDVILIVNKEKERFKVSIEECNLFLKKITTNTIPLNSTT